jgi:hypothetical protein
VLVAAIVFSGAFGRITRSLTDAMSAGQWLPEGITLGEVAMLALALRYLAFLGLAAWVVRDFHALRSASHAPCP